MTGKLRQRMRRRLPMKRDEVLKVLAEHREELQGFGVKRLAIFGSVARDEAGPESDVDLLVEFEGRATFDGYMELKFFLEGLLGHPVDLVTRRSLKPQLAPNIDREALYVA